MKYMRAIISNHPSYAADHNGELVACIEACMGAMAASAACADACLAEPDATEMTTCIRLNLDCSDLCAATGRILTRHVGHLTQEVIAQVNALAAVVAACGRECGQHAKDNEHCGICAQACSVCVEACRHLAGASTVVKATARGIEQGAALH